MAFLSSKKPKPRSSLAVTRQNKSQKSNGQVALFFTFAMVLVTVWFAWGLQRGKKSYNGAFSRNRDINVNVALLETGGSHDEVTAALYYALGSVPGVFTSMYLALPRFGIENVYAWMNRRYQLSPYSIYNPSVLQQNETETPDVIILATCEHDIHAADTILHYNFDHGSIHQTLICVVHHIDRFKSVEEGVRRWARADRLRFLTLSTHTADGLRNELNKYSHKAYKHTPIDTFPPLFPVPLDALPPEDNRLSIAIQGNFEDTRRDYLKTLVEFERMIDELPEPIVSRLQFILAGTGDKMGVPGRVLPYVSVNFSLDFIQYYNLLHQSFALLPAFADEGYYNTKASSSIAASFMAQSPILGSPRLLKSYGYLSKDAMWHADFHNEGGSEMTAIYEILREHFDDHGYEKRSWQETVTGKRRAVKEHGQVLMERNVRLMVEIIQGSFS